MLLTGTLGIPVIFRQKRLFAAKPAKRRLPRGLSCDNHCFCTDVLAIPVRALQLCTHHDHQVGFRAVFIAHSSFLYLLCMQWLPWPRCPAPTASNSAELLRFSPRALVVVNIVLALFRGMAPILFCARSHESFSGPTRCFGPVSSPVHANVRSNVASRERGCIDHRSTWLLAQRRSIRCAVVRFLASVGWFWSFVGSLCLWFAFLLRV
jgi:hypothetical protein